MSFIKGYRSTKKTLKKLSNLRSGKLPKFIPTFLGGKHTEEFKRKLTKRNMGNKVWLGKTHSEETKKKMALTRANFFRSNPDARKRVSLWSRGRKMSGEAKTSLSQKLKAFYSIPVNRERLRTQRLKQVMPFRDTSIEVKLQNFLKEQGVEFSTHYPILGQPDIFIKPNICIFADGCYWHGCPKCEFIEYKGRRKKDKDITKELTKQGYLVIRFWEHDIKRGIGFDKIKNYV